MSKNDLSNAEFKGATLAKLEHIGEELRGIKEWMDEHQKLDDTNFHTMMEQFGKHNTRIRDVERRSISNRITEAILMIFGRR